MKTQKDTDQQTTDLKSARLNYPNSTMRRFALQKASVGSQYPKPALSYHINTTLTHLFQDYRL